MISLSNNVVTLQGRVIRSTLSNNKSGLLKRKSNQTIRLLLSVMLSGSVKTLLVAIPPKELLTTTIKDRKTPNLLGARKLCVETHRNSERRKGSRTYPVSRLRARIQFSKRSQTLLRTLMRTGEPPQVSQQFSLIISLESQRNIQS